MNENAKNVNENEKKTLWQKLTYDPGKQAEQEVPARLAPLLTHGEHVEFHANTALGKHPYLRSIFGGMLFGSVFGITVSDGARRHRLTSSITRVVVTDRRLLFVTFRGKDAQPQLVFEAPRAAVALRAAKGHAMYPGAVVDIGGRRLRLSFFYGRGKRDALMSVLSAGERRGAASAAGEEHGAGDGAARAFQG